MKGWQKMAFDLVDVDEKEICEKWHVSSLTGKLIALSDLKEEEIRDLLSDDDHLSLSKADCVLKACQRILQAKENHEKIFVGGDYDADGICSTAIMKKTLDEMGIQNGYYIPDRFREGYGLSVKTVELAYQKGYSIIMTVDNGVKAHEALKRAKQLGMYVIVTDHHEIDEEIEADIVVHPDYMESEYAYLSGAGVALEISRNLIGTGSQYDELIAMCAIALIGDVMPLYRETRKLVKRGISILKQGRPRSLYVLLRQGATVDETAITFNIVPKLNVVGRMHDIGNVNTLVPYLLCQNETDIMRYSAQLNTVNERRKQLSESESRKAEKLMDTSVFPIIYEEDFHEGICGLVAGKIANKYHRPVLVMAKSEGIIKGSGRSVPGFNMFAFFHDFTETYAFGGHEMAVGISVKEEQFELFCEHVKQKSETITIPQTEDHEKAIRIKARDITFENLVDLEKLSPYPRNMIEPYFALQDAEILNIRDTPKTVRYSIASDALPIDAVVYKRKAIPCIEKPSGLIGKLQINRFQGRISLQLIVEEMKE